MMYLANPIYLLLGLFAVPMVYRAYMNDKREWKAVSVAYTVIVLLLAVAAASPQIQTASETVETRELIYLNDESRSMIDESPDISIDGVLVSERTLVSGNDSRIDRAMLSYLEPNSTYLVRSDFQGKNLEEVRDAYRRQNSTIHVLETDMTPEHAVSIQGPSLTVPGAENNYEIDMSSTEESPQPVKVSVDGQQVRSETTEEGFSIDRKFQEQGYYRIVATVNASDEYSENNRFYKSVKVVEKPELLVINERGNFGEGGELGEDLSEFYDITYRGVVPDDLSEYYAVVLKRRLESTAPLQSYLIEGNGLVYTGDGEMDILPVEETESLEGTEKPKVLIVFDNSVSGMGDSSNYECIEKEGSEYSDSPEFTDCVAWQGTGGQFDAARRVAKNLVHNLPRGTRAGVLMFNEEAVNISGFQALSFGREDIKSRIDRVPIVRAPTYYHVGLNWSKKLIGDRGNVVFITEGKAHGASTLVNSLEKSRTISREFGPDVKLFTVAIGKEKDKNKRFLKDLAENGGGRFYESPNEFYNYPPSFMGGGGAGNTETLRIYRPDHFITRDLAQLSAATSGFEQVRPKNSAQLLVTSTSGKPALTTWRYGLGRVASFSAGDSELTNIMSQEPELAARSVSWAAGNPQRKEERTVSVESGRVGESVEVTASFEMEGLNRESEGSYTGTLNPEDTGIHRFQDHFFAYNYMEEVQELGYNDEFIDSVTAATGGQVVTPSEVSSIEPTVPTETRASVESRSLAGYFLAAALLVYLAQIGYRKLKGQI